MANESNKNKEIAKILREIREYLLLLRGTPYRPRAYEKAAKALENLKEDIIVIYKNKGLKGLQEIKGIGKSIAKKIEEYLKTEKIKYLDELKEKTKIQQIVTHYFETKGLSLEQIKRDAKKKKIIYSRYTKPAKQLLELAGSVEKAKEAIDKVAEWAKSRGLDYAIETVFKKWLELDRLKPKEIVKKPFYDGKPMVWSQTHKKWYVIDDTGEWLEFAGDEKDIEWRTIK
jgi:ribosomal protein S13